MTDNANPLGRLSDGQVTTALANAAKGGADAYARMHADLRSAGYRVPDSVTVSPTAPAGPDSQAKSAADASRAGRAAEKLVRFGVAPEPVAEALEADGFLIRPDYRSKAEKGFDATHAPSPPEGFVISWNGVTPDISETELRMLDGSTRSPFRISGGRTTVRRARFDAFWLLDFTVHLRWCSVVVVGLAVPTERDVRAVALARPIDI